MASSYHSLIQEILATRKSRTNPHGASPETVIRRITELPPEYAAEIRSIARQLIVGLPLTGEGALNSMLEALTMRRDSAAGDLVIDALKSRHTMQKEDYVSMLEELDRSEDASASLLAVLADGVDDPDRIDLAVTIRALHSLQHGQAAPQILAYVDHPTRAVRGTAIEFLYQFDDGNNAGPLFIDQLTHEQEPHIMEMLIDSLTSWDQLPDEHFLREVADDSTQPHSLRQSARRALKYHSEGTSASGISDGTPPS